MGAFNREQKTDLGSVKIHKDAIANIALLAAKETAGVLGTTSGSLGGRVLKILGMEKFDHGVKIILQEGSVKINIGIVVEYNANISEVAMAVQENIKRQVENMVGISSAEVNVDVQKIETPKIGPSPHIS